MMRHIQFIFIVALLPINILGVAAENDNAISKTEEYFRWFAMEGIGSQTMSDESVRKTLSIGIHSEDAQVRAYTVQALSYYALAHEMSTFPEFSSQEHTLFRENLSVPGLKEFLINYHDSRATGPKDLPEFPSWAMVSRPLAFLFLKDDEVLEFIWDKSQTTYNRQGTLQMLNLGKFDTAAATQYRIESLFTESGFGEIWNLRHAAWGLARFQSKDGLNALVRRLEGEPHEDLNHVVDAVRAYGSEARPYLEQIRDLKSNTDELPNRQRFNESLNSLLNELDEDLGS